MRIRSGVLFSRYTILDLYKKEALTYQEQLDLLKSRGMVIQNEAKALHLLENLSYYRLSAYFYPQLTTNKEEHKYKEESYFDSSFKMYCFDRELRLLLLSNIEKIEISFRAKLTYVLSHRYDSFWYTYDKLFKNNEMHKKSIISIEKSINDSTEEFVLNYRTKYVDNYLPSWMALEIVTFSHLSKIYENLNDTKSKADVSDFFGLPYQLFENWLLIITYIRNICAHHSRFWNREFSLKARKSNKELSHNWINQTDIARNRSYLYISIIKYLIDRVNPSNLLKENLLDLFEKYNTIDIHKGMSFPQDWEEQPLWNSVTVKPKEAILKIASTLDDVLKASVPKPKKKKSE